MDKALRGRKQMQTKNEVGCVKAVHRLIQLRPKLWTDRPGTRHIVAAPRRIAIHLDGNVPNPGARKAIEAYLVLDVAHSFY